MAVVPKPLGRKITDLRDSRGFTQTQLAEASGLSQGHISRLENSQQTPTMTTLLRIRRGLALTEDEFQGLLGLALDESEKRGAA